ncbi:MAG: glycosyltransferase family 87 protein [Dehalococcoidia bacterium]
MEYLDGPATWRVAAPAPADARDLAAPSAQPFSGVRARLAAGHGWARAAVRADLPRAMLVGAILWLAIGLWLALIPSLLPQLRDARAPGPALDDFAVFYSAGLMVRHGQGSQLYDQRALAAQEARVSGRPDNGAPALPYFSPPAVAAALAPLTLLPVGTAAAVFLALSALLLVASLAMLTRASGLGYMSIWLVLGAGLAYQSVLDTLFHGQLSFILLFLFTAAFASFRSRHNGLGGFFLGLLLIKPNFVLLPLALLAWKRQRAALIGFGVAAAVVVGCSVAVAGPSVLWQYPQFLRAAAGWDDKNGISIAGMFGWNALVRGYFGPGHMTEVTLWSLALAVPTVAAVAWSWRGAWPATSSSLAVRYSTLLIGGLLINPHLYRQDMMLMLIPACLLAGAVSGRARVALGMTLLAAWGLFLYHFYLLRTLGWNVSVPALAVLLVIAAALSLRRHAARARSSEATESSPSAPVLAAPGAEA